MKRRKLFSQLKAEIRASGNANSMRAFNQLVKTFAKEVSGVDPEKFYIFTSMDPGGSRISVMTGKAVISRMKKAANGITNPNYKSRPWYCIDERRITEAAWDIPFDTKEEAQEYKKKSSGRLGLDMYIRNTLTSTKKTFTKEDPNSKMTTPEDDAEMERLSEEVVKLHKKHGKKWQDHATEDQIQAWIDNPRKLFAEEFDTKGKKVVAMVIKDSDKSDHEIAWDSLEIYDDHLDGNDATMKEILAETGVKLIRIFKGVNAINEAKDYCKKKSIKFTVRHFLY